MPPQSDEEMCAICLSTINENENSHHRLECNHNFHTECIVKWFRDSNGNCPCCRDNSKKKQSNYYGVWERPYINMRCNKLKKHSKNTNDNNLTKKIEKLTKKIDEYDNMVTDRKLFKKTEEYISSIKELNEFNRKINNKDRTIMNMKIDLVAAYPVVYCY